VLSTFAALFYTFFSPSISGFVSMPFFARLARLFPAAWRRAGAHCSWRRTACCVLPYLAHAAL